MFRYIKLSLLLDNYQMRIASKYIIAKDSFKQLWQHLTAWRKYLCSSIVIRISMCSWQYQFLVTMILYIQVTVSQYYLKSANTGTSYPRKFRREPTYRKILESRVNPSELTRQVVKLNVATCTWRPRFSLRSIRLRGKMMSVARWGIGLNALSLVTTIMKTK